MDPVHFDPETASEKQTQILLGIEFFSNMLAWTPGLPDSDPRDRKGTDPVDPDPQVQ